MNQQYVVQIDETMNGDWVDRTCSQSEDRAYESYLYWDALCKPGTVRMVRREEEIMYPRP